jgi:hypothetical protein
MFCALRSRFLLLEHRFHLQFASTASDVGGEDKTKAGDRWEGHGKQVKEHTVSAHDYVWGDGRCTCVWMCV